MTSTKSGAGTTRRSAHGTGRPAISDPTEARVPGPAPEPAEESFPAPPELRSTPELARPHRRARPPRVRLRLPDGQQLDVTLVSWHQYRDGTWRARVSWPVWGAVAHAGEVQTRTCAQEAFVPARMLTPLPGEDYRAVRQHRPRIAVPRRP
ncbi:hypothetical protein [Yinghuangia seranimata]|uniref:hypothetical protein n=1 Tax=Yinghuangia seranimata TaxID=408067 RepID=UPI00248B36E2|nr:hypothetical protein [Yinghuangia seranimata]MDI2126723.1 hypothetical protein [Yinghuangia seranimata]